MLAQAFQVWAGRTVKQRFAQRSKYLEAHLLCKRPAVQEALQQAHWLCLHLSSAAVPQAVYRCQQHQQLLPSTADAAGSSDSQQQQQQALQAGGPAAAQTPQQQSPATADRSIAVSSATAATALSGLGGLTSSIAALQDGSDTEPVWQKSAGTGRWRLVHHSSHPNGSSVSSNTAAAAAAGSGAGSTVHVAADGRGVAAAAAELVDELATAAQGLLPQLQSRDGTAGAVHFALSGGPGSGVAAAGVQHQMQRAMVHSKQLLKLLFRVMQAEVSLAAPHPNMAPVH